jgi:DNA replication protein
MTEQPNIFKLYEDNIGPITPLIKDKLLDAEEDYPQSWIQRAFEIAVEHNARNWSYIHAILERWRINGFDNGKNKTQSHRNTPEGRAKYAEYNPDEPHRKLREWAKK